MVQNAVLQPYASIAWTRGRQYRCQNGGLFVNATYDTEFARWIKAVKTGAGTGNYIDGPGAWDGYAAAAVCAAGVKSLETGQRVVVDMVARDSVAGA